MGIFRKGYKLEGGVSTVVQATTDGVDLESPITGQILPSYQADSLGLGFDDTGNVVLGDGFGMNALGDAIRSTAPVANYGDLTLFGDAAELYRPKQSSKSTNKISGAGGDMIDYWDIAQSHFFTVQIFNDKNGAGIHDANGTPFNFCSGEGTYRNYIPVKSMNFNYTTYDNMSIPLGIFGDFPLLHRKKVTSISFSCYDIDQDAIEKAVKYWEQQCFPNGLYVAYLEDIAAKLSYTSYDVKGRENFTRVLYVIPTGSVSVNRSYEENAAKMVNFSVVAVGSPGASATAGDLTGGQGIKERGYGNGNEQANRTYEMQVSAAVWNGNYRDTDTRNYAD